MSDLSTIDICALSEMAWEVDGEEYRIVRLSDIPADRPGQVELLQELALYLVGPLFVAIDKEIQMRRSRN